MAITDGYLTTNVARSYVGQHAAVPAEELDAVVSSVSRMIENYCERVFRSSTSAVRTFVPTDPFTLTLGPFNDAIAITKVEVDDKLNGTFVTLTAGTDYVTSSRSGAEAAQPIEALLAVGRQFPVPDKGQVVGVVKVTATWGWPAVPAPVVQACKIQTARIVARRDSPLGVAGISEVGVMRVLGGLDPDVRDLLGPYRYPWSTF